MTRKSHRGQKKSLAKVVDKLFSCVSTPKIVAHHASTKSSTYVPLPSKSGKYTGVLTSQLHKVRAQLSEAFDTTQYRFVTAKKRNHNREIHQLTQALVIQCAFNDHNHHRDDKKPIYFLDDTAGHESRALPQQSSITDYHLELLSSMTILDPEELETRDMKVMVGDRLIACKMSVLKRGNISKQTWIDKHGPALAKAILVQPDNVRGSGQEGMYEHSVNMGFRSDYLWALYIALYAKKCINTSVEDAEIALDGVRSLVEDVEAIISDIIPGYELSARAKIMEACNGNAVMLSQNEQRNSHFSQSAIATKYWSPSHTDKDHIMTMLGGYSPSITQSGEDDAILFYFVFPSIGKAIPMRSTDILLFDSRVAHCATNYRHEDSYIFSLFTSSKTIHTKMAAVEAASKKKSRRQDRLTKLNNY